MKQTMKTLLALLMALALLPLGSMAALGETVNVAYLNLEGRYVPMKCTVVTSSDFATWSDPWYAVTESGVKISGGTGSTPSVTVSGNVNLILRDGASLETANGIYVPRDASLTIWAESAGDGMGSLTAKSVIHSFSDGKNAAIGGIEDKVAGAITINGGNIWADSFGGAGIGGGQGDDSGYTSITINGGKVVARGGGDDNSQFASGIGPGKSNDTYGTITITGGSVEAQSAGRYAAIGAMESGSHVVITGGRVKAETRPLASIKGSYGIAGQTVTINAETAVEGDYVKAVGYSGYSGIHGTNITISGGSVEASVPVDSDGGGITLPGESASESITISGGTVTATGGKGAGIGTMRNKDFKGTINISGGTVTATSVNTSERGGAGIGSAYGGNAKDGHIIITGGNVTAKGGEKAAGIGGGGEYTGWWNGPGGEGCGDVQILGGTVVAQAGGDESSAIGHGHTDEYYGNIAFADDMKVRAGWSQSETEASEPFEWNSRALACMYRWYAIVEPCEHPWPMVDGLPVFPADGITATTHRRSSCKYCCTIFETEPHDFDDAGMCMVCGYSERGYRVSFDANGAEGDMEDLFVAEGRPVLLPNNLFETPDGKAFGGWKIGDEVFPAEWMVRITENVTAVAQWIDLGEITFDANGGTGEMVAEDPRETFPLPPCAFTPPEWDDFVGWEVNGDSEHLKQPLDKITLTGEPTVIKAIWNRPEYTVTFDPKNGGDTSAVTVPRGDTVPQPDDPTREGYVFKGWQIEDEVYIFDSPVVDNITLTAIWAIAWDDLQSEINAVESGATVTMIKDVVADDDDVAIVIPEGKNVTIDLNGHTINRNRQSEIYDGYVLRVDGALTLTDSVGSGAITGGRNIGFGGGVLVTQGGAFTLEGGAITGNRVEESSVGGGVYVEEGGAFTMNGGTISGGDIESRNAFRGGAVYADGAFTLNGGAIACNKAPYGAGVQIGCGTFTMNGGSINGNEATFGGAALIEADGAFTMTGGTISGNRSDTFGAVYVDEGGALALTGGIVIEGNEGGNVYLGRNVVVDIAGALTDTANVGITMHEPGTFTQGMNGMNYFFSDDDRMMIVRANSGELCLIERQDFGTPDFTLPASITLIEEYAFQGIDAQIVYIPDGCTEIEPYAFKDCKKLTRVRIPAGCAIGEFAFDGCEDLYIFSTPGGGAEQYCANHGNCTFVAEQ